MSAVTVRALDEYLTAARVAVRAAARSQDSGTHVVAAASAQTYIDRLGKAPRLVVVAHLARLTVRTAAGPRLTTAAGDVVHGVVPWVRARLTVVVRPCDAVADLRRWRWVRSPERTPQYGCPPVCPCQTSTSKETP